jgi:hypothetical protein
MPIARRKDLVSFLLAAALVGCSHTESHPQTWGKIPPELRPSECLPITGVYNNTGENAEGKRVKLAWMLMGDEQRGMMSNDRLEYERELRDAQTVRLVFDGDGLLKLEATCNGKSIKWALDNAVLKDGVITINHSGEASAVNVVAHSWMKTEIIRTDDYLQIHKAWKTVGVMLLVPAWERQKIWARFPVNPTQNLQGKTDD